MDAVADEAEYAELSANTRGGARGLLVPPTLAIGRAHQDALLPETVAEVVALDLRPAEAVFDRGFSTRATLFTMAELGSRVFIACNPKNGGSQRTRRRLASYRVGCDGRMSHLKREYGGGRSRLKGEAGAKIWADWSSRIRPRHHRPPARQAARRLDLNQSVRHTTTLSPPLAVASSFRAVAGRSTAFVFRGHARVLSLFVRGK